MTPIALGAVVREDGGVKTIVGLSRGDVFLALSAAFLTGLHVAWHDWLWAVLFGAIVLLFVVLFLFVFDKGAVRGAGR